MSGPFRIKVCGMTSEEAARAALDAGADHLGFVFCPSVRRVSREEAAGLAAKVPAEWVGVFADATLDEMTAVAGAVGLAALQLHGGESPELCRAVRKATGLPVWKALPPDLRPRADAYASAADALLLDARRGGSGRTLDWGAVAEEFPRDRRTVPIFLAGGLDADNVATAVRTADPDGVDASSGLERAPGIKDPARVRAYVRAARAAAGTRSRTGAAR